MLKRRRDLSVLIRLALAVAGTTTFGSQSNAQSQILRWEIEGTVVEVGDADKIFKSVRLGDPVRGFLTYNHTLPPTIGSDLYEQQPFVVAGLTLENPRDDSKFEFVADAETLGYILVGDDYEAPPPVGKFDQLNASQSVVPPSGFSGFAPTVNVYLNGPPKNFSDNRLPNSLDLDDWPDATIAFYDIFWFEFDAGDPSSYVIAEIHTLTSVEPPIVPGDFNQNSFVDDADYVAWRDGLGTTYTEADYDRWRADFGRNAASATAANAGPISGANPAVPEPYTSALVLSILIPTSLRFRRRYLSEGAQR